MATDLILRNPGATPQETNSQLRSLASSRGVEISRGKRLKGIYDDTGALIGSTLVPEPIRANGSPVEMAAMADAITETLVPASRDTIEEWLAELYVIAPSRADDEMTATLKLEAYGRRLAEYPADMVKHVLLSKTWRFFPSWYELEEQLKPMKSERDGMLAACLRAQYPNEPTEPPEPPDRITKERAAEIMAEAGFKPKTFGGDA